MNHKTTEITFAEEIFAKIKEIGDRHALNLNIKSTADFKYAKEMAVDELHLRPDYEAEQELIDGELSVLYETLFPEI